MIRSTIVGTALLVSGGTVGYGVGLDATTPFEHYLACTVGVHREDGTVHQRPPILAGRVIHAADGRIVELVGPVAATDSAAAAAAVDYGVLYGARCQPVPMWDIWRLSDPSSIDAIGR